VRAGILPAKELFGKMPNKARRDADVPCSANGQHQAKAHAAFTNVT
jgi:hypothetical protein